MLRRTIMVVTDDDALAHLLEIHLPDAGYQFVTQPPHPALFVLINRANPDLVMLSLPDNPRTQPWRILKRLQSADAPRPVVAIVNLDTCGDNQRHWLRQNGIPLLPLVFDLDDLLSTVASVLQATPSHDTDAVVQSSPKSYRRRVDDVPEQQLAACIEALNMQFEQRHVPSDALSRIAALTEERRDVLSRTMLAGQERVVLLAAIDAELDRMWLRRRKELMRGDPNVAHLPIWHGTDDLAEPLAEGLSG